MSELHRLASAHLDALLAFERENRAYFARSVTDRGDDFYGAFAEHHRTLLKQQDDGDCVFYVLMDRDGFIVGRFNLYDVDDAAARVGYRVAERATGRGIATRALIELCRRAQRDHELRTLTAETSAENVASQRVLAKAGFVPVGPCIVAGNPGQKFMLRLAEQQT